MINISKTTKQQRIKSPQGERLKELRFAKGFTKKSTFAREIKSTHSTVSAIENYGREISEEFYDLIAHRFPNVNTEWLRNGTGTMLKNEGPETGHFSIVLNEPKTSYEQLCDECRKKDLIISELQKELLTAKNDLIECLREQSGKKSSSG